MTMASVVLRVRFVGGNHIDVTYDQPGADQDSAVEHVLATLADDAGALRTTHGDRMVVIYGRGVAAVEVGPRGAVL
jgi:hypothetical protein